MKLEIASTKAIKDDFLQRCMADGTMLLDFPDPSQRYAICEQQVTRNETRAKDVMKIEQRINSDAES